MDLRFRLLNVFSIDGDPFSGNPLCVFEDADALTDRQMQAWARQFNLSETTFVTATRAESDDLAEADVRIFTASYEMPFAGHPTLGTAHVVAAPAGGIDAVALSMPAGRIPVRRVDGGWRLRANPARARPVRATAPELAEVLGTRPEAVVPDGGRWVDSGVEQLIVELADGEAVRSCQPDPRGMRARLSVPGREPQVYVWARTAESMITARFFAVSGSALEEDAATGSAAANLGGWLALTGRRDELITISQGDQVARPSRLVLSIDYAGTVWVGGQVTDVGSGAVHAG
ncbi:MAG TPA: PhzF family phenazine biosynthesis protein [Intrasporangium sp.]|nr:PhzF family phenazine biosynthesis protein [Intrasporangium sp.]